MARPDRHTPCPACHHAAREVYYAGLQLLEVADDLVVPSGQAVAFHMKVEALREAVKAFMPIVAAHNANQEHALSPELVNQREGLWR